MDRRSERELKQLAINIQAGRVFGSWNIPEHDTSSVPLVFMPLALADERLDPDIGHVYEYMYKAGPRSVNGYPSFFSMHLLHKEDVPVLAGLLKALKQRQEEFLEQPA